MFDLTSSKLLILGIIALLVVGPKDMPVLLRTIGKYVAILRRHANEFRAQFEAAMNESDLASLKSEVEGLKRDVSATVSAAGRSIEADVASAKGGLENSIRGLDTTQSQPTPAAAELAPAELAPAEPAPHVNGASISQPHSAAKTGA